MTRDKRSAIAVGLGWLAVAGLAAVPLLPMLRTGSEALHSSTGAASSAIPIGCAALGAVCIVRRWPVALSLVGLIAVMGAAYLNWRLYAESWDLTPSPIGWGASAYFLAGLLAVSAGVLARRRAG